ncbi:unnamed protein product [Orchesella dallaii]|uniref:RRM domain-containing protein n=1 Tax=Orchesella dallaii TaxID=48710 RepID=A0ABP1PJ28_9HEXA
MSGSARNMLRVFVGNLPWTIGSMELRHFASSFGLVTHSQVAFDRKTGLSKGFGFVTFANREGYNSLLKGSGGGSHFLEGQHLNVNPANGYVNHPSGEDN